MTQGDRQYHAGIIPTGCCLVFEQVGRASRQTQPHCLDLVMIELHVLSQKNNNYQHITQNATYCTFIARAMRAPSVGRPIRLLLLITASLHTQPAYRISDAKLNMSHYSTQTAELFIIFSSQPHLHYLADGGVGETMHHLSIQQYLTRIVVPDTGDL